MRLWSLHPAYLDTKGLLAAWREGLLAKKVIEGKTRGYRFHPQLCRFRDRREPLRALNAYLYQLWLEAERRDFRFDRSRIMPVKMVNLIPVTRGQIRYEFAHLLAKTAKRDKKKHKELKKAGGSRIMQNPVFYLVPGDIEVWEKKT